MDTQIAYNRQQVLTENAYVTDVGNCALEATDDQELYYYLVTKTVDGTTFVLEYGPVIPDIIELPKSYSVSFLRKTYDDEKLAKFIQGWAAPKKGPNYTVVKQVTHEEALAQYRDAKDYFVNQ